MNVVRILLCCCMPLLSVVTQADGISTLSDVLDASGITASGHISASWVHSDGTSTYHVFDAGHDSLQLNQMALTVAYLPMDSFGANVEIMAGQDVAALPTSSQGMPSGNQIEATQAYVQYTTRSAVIMVGKFWTLAGAEMTPDPGNSNISRSLLFFLAEAASHTGIRTQLNVSDAFSVILGINNGWNTAGRASGSAKTVEAGFTFTPASRLTLTVQMYAGKDPAYEAQRRLINVLATYRATDTLTLIVSHDRGSQAQAMGPGTPTGRWHGVSLYVNQAFNPQWRSSLRLERFSDPDAAATGTSQVLKEATLTLAYAPVKHVEARVEVRRDQSSQSTLISTHGTPRNRQTEVALQGVYKF